MARGTACADEVTARTTGGEAGIWCTQQRVRYITRVQVSPFFRTSCIYGWPLRPGFVSPSSSTAPRDGRVFTVGTVARARSVGTRVTERRKSNTGRAGKSVSRTGGGERNGSNARAPLWPDRSPVGGYGAKLRHRVRACKRRRCIRVYY